MKLSMYGNTKAQATPLPNHHNDLAHAENSGQYDLPHVRHGASRSAAPPPRSWLRRCSRAEALSSAKCVGSSNICTLLLPLPQPPQHLRLSNVSRWAATLRSTLLQAASGILSRSQLVV
eukprot:TRINITY_DN50_c1_g1_i4.p1 TRINITY_DN50_c1_g1~~TRINITY_DN50_c1_g1_i4.p1  ORF type:complete len:119 (+),score=0.81 TRINITY_DN50_c1_g1_i4:299-655(+)